MQYRINNIYVWAALCHTRAGQAPPLRYIHRPHKNSYRNEPNYMRTTTFKTYRLKKAAILGVIAAFIAAIVAAPQTAILAGRNALELCANVLIPSLFPFFVFSGLLIRLGFANIAGRVMRPIMAPLFGVSGNAALALVLGAISGYPIGAACVCDLYSGGYIGRREAERLVAFCNNSGPLFIIGAVGAAMYGNTAIGMTLYITHVLSSLTIGVILRIREGALPRLIAKPSAATPKRQSFGEVIVEVMRSSITNILTICSFTLFFGVIAAIILSAMPLSIANSGIGQAASGLLDISAGVNGVFRSGMVLQHKLVFTAAVIGFAGFGVHVQVMGIMAKTDLRFSAYLKGKIMQAMIAALYMWITVGIVL